MILSLRKVSIFGRFPFVRLLQVFHNPLYAVHLLKKNLFYKREVCNYSPRYEKFKFLDGSETLNHVVENRTSLARFSDGEIGILMGASIIPPDSNWSQTWSKKLKNELAMVLNSNKKNLMVAVDPPGVFLASKTSVHPIRFEWNMWVDTRRTLFKFLVDGNSYGHCHLFLKENSPEFDWNKFKSYISDRNVIVAAGNTGKLSHLDLGCTTDFIECGVDNAFEKKEWIKSKVYECIETNKYDKSNILLMLCLGPTACILAYELDDLQVLDTGHIFEFAAEGFIENNLSSLSL